MSTNASNKNDVQSIPVILLKTKSTPDDTYDETFQRFRYEDDTSKTLSYTFTPHFIPVLEHTRNEQSLQELADLLRSRKLKRKYGGMIFTSQRAVEAWTHIVNEVDAEKSAPLPPSDLSDPFGNIDALTAFPLYVVGPATERALQTLIASSHRPSPFSTLNPSIHGAHSGNGASLAAYMLDHYNWVYGCHWFDYFEAPRLPFIPLLGMSSQNYGRKRLEKDDPRLAKKPLLFLVGEVRRDIIPKTLTGAEGARKIGVDEVEVYRTEVMKSMETDLDALISEFNNVSSTKSNDMRIVVVFSPQGTEAVLKKIGYLDAEGKPTNAAENRWYTRNLKSFSDVESQSENGGRWIVVTIGPTTRDFMKEKLGLEPDICSEKPSPEGLKDGIEAFLKHVRTSSES